ncbi:MAG: tyrosine-protein phosphatase [Siphonobacter sp.]
MNIKFLFFPVIYLIVTPSFALPAPPAIRQKAGHLHNFYLLNNQVYRSEQPTRKEFKALEQFGIKEVISMRRGKNRDIQRAEGTHLTLHQVPMNAGHLDEKSIIDILRLIKNSQGPILFHCWHGSDRTGVIAAMYRIVFENWSKEAAIDEMEHGGFGFHRKFKKSVPAFIQSLDIDAIRKQVLQT